MPFGPGLRIGGQRRAVFSPKQISGLQLWLAADKITGSGDGAALAAWSDLSGVGNNAAQSNPANRPIFKIGIANDLPVVRFAGSPQTLVIPNHASLSITTQGTFVAVARPTATNATQRVLDKVGAYSFGQSSAGSGILTGYGAGDMADYGLYWDTSAFSVLGAIFDTAHNTTWWWNGSKRATMGVSGDIAASSNALWVGGRNAGTQYWTGDIAEVLLWNRAITTGEMAVLMSYLIHKWGLARPATSSNPNLALTANAAGYLATPTYDGSNNAMHPSVVDLGAGNAWNGHRYWMAMTPLPNGQDTYEDPSILVSADGTTWSVPVGLTNPIEPHPGAGYHNADTHLILGQDNNLWCFWVYNNQGTDYKAFVAKSADGVTWTGKTQILSGGAYYVLSPAVIWDGSQYVMWHYVVSSAVKQIVRRTAAAPDGPWSAATPCSIAGVVPPAYGWHLDVKKRGSEYHLFLTVNTPDNKLPLYFATSTDGLIWTLSDAPLLAVSAAGWDKTNLYRSCAVSTATGYDLWYSGNGDSSYHIGRTAVTGV